MVVRECQNADNIDKCLCSNSDFSKTTGLITSEKVAINLLVLFEWFWVDKLSIPFLHGNIDGPDVPELFVVWAHLDVGTRVSPNQRV